MNCWQNFHSSGHFLHMLQTIDQIILSSYFMYTWKSYLCDHDNDNFIMLNVLFGKWECIKYVFTFFIINFLLIHLKHEKCWLNIALQATSINVLHKKFPKYVHNMCFFPKCDLHRNCLCLTVSKKWHNFCYIPIFIHAF